MKIKYTAEQKKLLGALDFVIHGKQYLINLIISRCIYFVISLLELLLRSKVFFRLYHALSFCLRITSIYNTAFSYSAPRYITRNAETATLMSSLFLKLLFFAF